MLDIEKLVLQYSLLAPDTANEMMAAGIDASYFLNITNQMVARTMFDHFKTYSQPISSQALRMKLMQLQVPPANIEEYLTFDPNPIIDMNVDWLITELRSHKKKNIIEVGIQDAIMSLRSTNPLTAESNLQKTIAELSRLNTSNKLVSNMNDDIGSLISALSQPKTENFFITGYAEMDEATGGFLPGWLVLLAALPKIGKTRTLVNMACNYARKGMNVLVFSLEIAKEQYVNLCLSCFTRTPYAHVEKHMLTPEEMVKMKELEHNMQNGYGKLDIVDTLGSCTPADIQSWITKQQQEKGMKYDIIIVDHASMMRPDIPTGKDHIDQSQIALELKSMARKNNQVFLVALQRKNDEKNRRVAKKDEEVQEAGGESIGRSFTWYQLGDIVMIIQNDRPDDLAISTLKFSVTSRWGACKSFALIKDFNTTAVLSIKDNPQMKGMWDDETLG